jgi:hypothetical protein
LLLALGLTLPKLGLAAPPTDTAAPRMSTVRTIDDALALERGASCLDRQTLLADIRSWRGKDRVEQRVAVRVSGSPDDPRAVSFVIWVADELVVERAFDLDPSDCANVHAVVSLAISIALDDSLPVELGIIDAPVEPVEQAQPGDTDVPDFTDAQPEPAPGRRTTLSLTAAAGAFVEVTPRLSGGGLLSFDIRPLDHFDIRVGGLATYLPGHAIDLGQVDITLAAGRLDLCWGTLPRRVRARVCGGAAAGAVVASGRGFTVDFRRSLPYFAALVGADVAIHLIGPLGIELRLDAVVPLQQIELDVRSTTGQLLDRERFSPAGLVVAIGPRFEF